MDLLRISVFKLLVGVLFLTATITAEDIDEDFLRECVDIGRNVVDRAIRETQSALLDRKARSSSDLLTLFRFPSPEIVEIARAHEVFGAAMEVMRDHDGGGMRRRRNAKHTSMTRSVVESMMAMSNCTEFNKDVSCDDVCFHAKYRTADGTCNNIAKPTQGAALTPFARLLFPRYEDIINEPVGWNRGPNQCSSLPSPRKVSIVVGSTDTVSDDLELSNFVMLFGQFLDHDLDLTPQSPSSVSFTAGVKCSDTCDNTAPCFPIQVPEGDPRIMSVECLEFIRSSAVCGTGIATSSGKCIPREQINALTSYIDGSQIYGSSKSLADDLRAFDGKGSLRVNDEITEVPTGRPLLPYDPDSPMECLSNNSSQPIPCFLAGDVRSNEQIGLTCMHTLFLREHNRISGMLSLINPHWDDETLYQEARKIMGAQLQHIVYDHYLPKVLGPEGMDQLGTYQEYNPSADASIANVFATATFRFGHGTVRPIIPRLDENLNPIPEGNLQLHLAFFQPWRIVEQGGIDPILRGFSAKGAKELLPDEIMTEELTEHLFELAEAVALDLMALNIQRGRDHGLPSYSSWRKKCGLHPGNTFDDLKHEISNQGVLDKLEELYGSPRNIDLFIGAMAEDSLPGSILGPTFRCLLITQFRNTRAGDRFWHEKDGVFTAAQLAEIRKQSIARVICDNTDIDQVQADVFLNPTTERPLLGCSQIDGMDLTAWTDTNQINSPPNITCPTAVLVETGNPCIRPDISWDDPVATDSSGNALEVLCSHTPDSMFPVGTTTVTCSATDSSGACSTCTFTVTYTVE
ncbi:peroxidasin-like [Ptychodera flava]|uniref:peroxidasin-like n=1 Tax=Ptychodera flava TaxID=63121 RepID=UPI003969F3BF